MTVHNVRDFKSWLTKHSENTDQTSLRLALVDLGLPDGSGTEILQKLSEKEPQASTIVITIYDEDSHLFNALSAGASGYILKDESPENFINLLRRIENNEPALSASLARRLLKHFAQSFSKPKNEVELTSRETETLTLIARGLTVNETASTMGLSAQTIAGYIKIIYQKLQISNRAEATREALRRGLT